MQKKTVKINSNQRLLLVNEMMYSYKHEYNILSTTTSINIYIVNQLYFYIICNVWMLQILW
jgi:hypothetical protein